MIWLIIILGYFIPLISILLIIYYCELNSGETFKEYFRQNENLLVATVVHIRQENGDYYSMPIDAYNSIKKQIKEE